MNIWLVAFKFPPINTIGAERPKKFLRYFNRSDRNTITVFSVAGPGEEFGDTFEGVKIRRSAVRFPEYHFRHSGDIGRPSRAQLLIPRVLTTILDDSGWTWMRDLSRDLEHAVAENERPDVVIATGRPFLTFLTVSRFCRRHKIPFVLDYRDAWSDNPHPRYDNWARRTFLRWLEGHVNRQANLVLTVSNLTAAAINSDKQPHVIYNLPDKGYIREIKGYTKTIQPTPRSRLSLVFTGTLYPGRDLDPICAAIAQLEDKHRELIEVHYCGHSSDRANNSFRKNGIDHCLISHGSISKGDAVRLVAASDIALSVVCSDEGSATAALRGVITTKVFDYLILGKEVMNIVPKNFEFNDFSKRIGLSGLKNFEPSDTNGMTSYIRERLQVKLASGETLLGASDGASALDGTWEAQMGYLDTLLNEIVK